MPKIDCRKIIQTEWYQEGGAMAPFYISLAYCFYFKRVNAGAFYSRNFVAYSYYNKRVQYQAASALVNKTLKTPFAIDKEFKQWQKDKIGEEQFIENFQFSDFQKLSDQDLLKLYRQFTLLREKIWGSSRPYILELFNAWDEHFLNKVFTRFSMNLPRQEIQILSSSTTPGFFALAQQELLKLFKIYQRKDKNFPSKLELYSKKYHWLQNNWAFAKNLDEEYWRQRIKKTNRAALEKEIKNNLRHLQFLKRKQREIIQKRKISQPLRNFFYFFRRMGGWRDERKKQILMEVAMADKFLKEFSRRTKINYSILKYSFPYDWESFKISPALVKKWEMKEMILVVGLGLKKYKCFYGKEARRTHQYFEKSFLIKQKEIIKGNSASLGEVKGRIKIIITENDFKKMKKGDVLVTQMTRPEFVPILKLASAIITDEGGITCHAAIISRELNIPCIIGTQVATKILKDGMKVEVNANKGIVKIIK